MTIEQLKQMIRTLGKGGSISISNRQILEDAAYKMGISDDDLQRIIDDELNGVSNTHQSTSASSFSKPKLGLTIKMNAEGKRIDNSQSRIQSKPTPPPQPEQPSQPTPQPEPHTSTKPESPNPAPIVVDNNNKQMRRMKVMLMITGVLLLGVLLFVVFNHSPKEESKNGNNNVASDTIAVADTTTIRNNEGDTATIRNNDGVDTTATEPPREVLDLDKFAANLLEQKADDLRQNNQIEQARRLYDSAYHKNPNNSEIKRKLD